jgi:KAP family P-loop domain/WD domain, G-beta repeat
VAEPVTQDLTPTVRSIAEDLGGPVTAAQVVDALMRRHPEYGSLQRYDLSWPPNLRVAPVERWLDDARELFDRQAHAALHGRIVLLGVGLLDPAVGRALARAGLFHAVGKELTPAFWEGLTHEGQERLEAIPILIAAAGFALGSAQLGVPVPALTYNAGGNLIAAARGLGWIVLRRFGRQEVAAGDLREVVTGVAFTARGQLVVGASQRAGVIRLRDQDEAWRESAGETLAVGNHGDQALAATSDLQLVYLPSGRTVVLGEGPPATAAAFAEAAARLARVDADGSITVWDTETGGLRYRVEPATSSPATAFAVSADGNFVLTAHEDGAVWFHSAEPTQVGFGRSGVAAAAFSPGGERVAVTGYGTAIWDARTGSLVADMVTDGYSRSLAFSPNGEFLATGEDSGTLRVYAAASGALIAAIPVAGAVMSLAWSPDGEELAVGTDTGALSRHAATLDPQRRTRLASYSPDDVDAASQLSVRQEIDDDVDAFAALLAARAVTPPLSIGLFGDWGSGKTFFMRRLCARVAQLAGDARDSGELQRDVAWHKRIVQVEFNAWHYAEGNLWASLVEHILDNLALSPDEPAERVEKRKEQVVKQITAQRGVTEAARAKLAATHAALEETAGRRDELAQELAEVEAEDPLAQASPLLPVIEDVRDAATRVDVPAARRAATAETFAELSGALDNARTVLRHGRAATAPLLYAPDRRRRFIGLLVVLVGAPALALLAGLLVPDVVKSLTAAATGIAAALAGVAEWARRQLDWTRARLADLDTAAQKLEEPERELLEARARERRRLEAEHEAATRAAAVEESRLHELESSLAAATPARMLAQLVADRVESDDYRRHLGVLALVRRDFEAMSEYLRLQAEEIEAYETLEDEESEDNVRVGRIVLYIDDLDRCEPQQVVAVLQAVHLLLAFPLFVVVVGVDMRWVERSLKLRHEHLLASGDAAPRDYLEKIFQIPFWLEPLDAEASRRMLRGFVGDWAAAPTARREAGAPAPPPEAPQSEGTTNGAGSLPQAEAAGPHAAEPLPPSRELMPDSLDIQPRELECMDELAALLGRSPRALKRFVNTYRLIKVRSVEPAALLRDDPPIAAYRAILFLLALCTGAPHAAAAFLDAAIASDPNRVADVLAGEGEERGRIDAWLADPASEPWRDLAAADLRLWAGEVVRFTFHWHAQSRYA